MDRKAYIEEVMDHCKHPRNRGSLANADFCAQDANPLCGDEIKICGKVQGGRLAEIKFDGHGCAICIAASSMLTESAKGKSLKSALGIKREAVLADFGGKMSPVRTKCALLALKTLKIGICGFLGEKGVKKGKMYESL